jgi:hypothetical protein
MSMKITVPWHIRLPVAQAGSPSSRSWWSRKQGHEQALSTPLRSVTMKEDDLDHLGTLHHDIEQPPKRWWRK